MNNHHKLDKVFIASGNKQNTIAMLKLLKPYNIPVISTEENGLNALQKLAEESFDLIIVDSQLKYISGLLFVKEKKTSEKIPNMACILFGSDDDSEIPEGNEEYGLVKYAKLPLVANQFEFILTSTLSLFRTSGTIESKYTIAKKAFIEEKSEEAVELYAELHGLTQKNARSSMGLAQAYDQDNQKAKAEETMIELAKSGQGNLTSLLIALKLYLRKGEDDKATGILEQIMADPSPYHYVEGVKHLLQFKQWESIRMLCESAIKLKYKLGIFHISLAKCRYACEDFDEALQILETANENFGETNESLNLQGVCYKKVGAYSDAKHCYEQALKLAPGDSKVYFNLAICSLDLQDFEEAKKYLETCLELAPNFTRAKVKLEEIMEKVA